MQREEEIIGMLEQAMGKLDNHSAKLDEHSQILTAFRFGQEYLKAEMDGMKVSNTKEFEVLKEQISEVEGENF